MSRHVVFSLCPEWSDFGSLTVSTQGKTPETHPKQRKGKGKEPNTEYQGKEIETSVGTNVHQKKCSVVRPEKMEEEGEIF